MLSLYDGQLRIISGQSIFIGLTLSGAYPDIKRLIQKTKDYTEFATVVASDLMYALSLTTHVASFDAVDLELTNGTLTVAAEDKESGAGKVEVRTLKSSSGKMKFSIRQEYVKDFVKAFKGDIPITIAHNGTDLIRLTGPGTIYAVAPLTEV